MITGYLKKPAIIFLDSKGGMTWTGVQIGRIIRELGVTTVVADNVACSSACALVWVGGKERYVGTHGHIGFHASKSAETGEPSSHGNAIVGAYLFEMGITGYQDILFLTKTPPQSMTWVTLTDVLTHGIRVDYYIPSQHRWSWVDETLKSAPAPSDRIGGYILGVSQK